MNIRHKIFHALMRLFAGAWLSTLMTCIIISIAATQQAVGSIIINPVILMILTSLIIIIFYLSWRWVKAPSFSSTPAMIPSLIAAIWFTICLSQLEYLTLTSFIHTTERDLLRIAVITTILGFSFFSYIFLLPWSLRGALKTVWIGYTGSFLTLFIALFFLFLPAHLSGLPDALANLFFLLGPLHPFMSIIGIIASLALFVGLHAVHWLEKIIDK